MSASAFPQREMSHPTMPCPKVVKSVWKCKSLSHVRLFAIPWTVACQAPLSMEFSSQEYWSGLPFPSPGGLRDPGIEPVSPALLADSLLAKFGPCKRSLSLQFRTIQKGHPSSDLMELVCYAYTSAQFPPMLNSVSFSSAPKVMTTTALLCANLHLRNCFPGTPAIGAGCMR